MYFSDIATTSTTTITKASLMRLGESIRPYIKPLVIVGALFLLLFGTVFATAIWLGFHLLYLLVPAVLIYLYSRFLSTVLTWREAYIVVIYASIPVAILTFFVHLIGTIWPIFFYTLGVIVVAIVNLTHERVAKGEVSKTD